MSGYMDILRESILGDSFVVYIIAFLTGIISSLNPHMLGMMPIYINYILNSSVGRYSKFKAFIFILSFTVVLTSLGMTVSILGISLHPLMTLNYLLVAIFYLYLGLKLLGIRLTFKLPFKIIFFYSGRKSLIGGGFISTVFIPLIFTPCSLPFIVSLLGLIILKGSILHGGLILLSFSLGHSLIFLLFGLFSGQMITYAVKLKDRKLIKVIFGIVFIFLSMVFLSYILQPKAHINH